jgi:hypothetical protein
MNKKRKYLKDKNNEFAMNSNNKNIIYLYKRINKFKRNYQHTSNLVNDENGDLLAGSHNILNKWKNYYSQLLYEHTSLMLGVHTAEQLLPDNSPY